MCSVMSLHRLQTASESTGGHVQLPDVHVTASCCEIASGWRTRPFIVAACSAKSAMAFARGGLCTVSGDAKTVDCAALQCPSHLGAGTSTIPVRKWYRSVATRRVLHKSLVLHKLLREGVKPKRDNEGDGSEERAVIPSVGLPSRCEMLSEYIRVWNTICKHPTTLRLARSMVSNCSSDRGPREKEFHFDWPMADARAKRALSLQAVARRDTSVFKVTPLQDWISWPAADDKTPTNVRRQMMLKEIAAISRIHVLATFAPNLPHQLQKEFHLDIVETRGTDQKTQRKATAARAGRWILQSPSCWRSASVTMRSVRQFSPHERRKACRCGKVPTSAAFPNFKSSLESMSGA